MLFEVFQGLDSVREVLHFGSFRWRQGLAAVVQTSSSCLWVTHSSQSSPLFQAWIPFSSTNNFHRDQEVLQLLIHLVRHAEVVLEMCHGDQLFLVFSAFFIACFEAVRTTPKKSLARCGQVLQLGPVFFPNQSGIKPFGSTHRMRDLVSI